MEDIFNNWWPAPESWPEANGNTRLWPEAAVALMLLSDDVVVVNGAKLVVLCNGLFYWECADAEPLPTVGYEDDREELFWQLYERIRANPKWGSAQWCILQRKQKPQKAIEEEMKEEGAWLPEFDTF